MLKEEVGSECFTGTEFQFGKMESSGAGRWGWLCNNVNVLHATEHEALRNGEDGKFYVLCILQQ